MFGRKRSIETRVQKGMQLLDKNRPGWDQHIDLAVLDIARGDRCALGQTYGAYYFGIQALGLTLGESRDHGFHSASYALYPQIDREYEVLTAEWRHQIKTRQKEMA